MINWYLITLTDGVLYSTLFKRKLSTIEWYEVPAKPCSSSVFIRYSEQDQPINQRRQRIDTGSRIISSHLIHQSRHLISSHLIHQSRQSPSFLQLLYWSEGRGWAHWDFCQNCANQRRHRHRLAFTGVSARHSPFNETAPTNQCRHQHRFSLYRRFGSRFNESPVEFSN